MMHFLHKLQFKICCQLLVFLLVFSQSSFSQVHFSAVTNEKEVGKNDVFQVQFKIENAQSVRSIDPPAFENFDIVGGPNQETGTVITNGNRSFYAAVSFILKPRKTGTFSIPPAVAIADGKQVKSNSLTIKVIARGTAKRSTPPPPVTQPFGGMNMSPPSTRTVNEDYILKPGENVAEKIKKNLFVKLKANKTECYVGEPVVVSFQLFTRLLSKTNITDAPSFNGFSVTEMDVNENATEVMVDGRKFNCYTLRKVQLFPMRPGTYTISPLHAVNRVNFLRPEKNSRDEEDPFFQLLQEIGAQSLSAGGMVEEHVTNASNSLTIHVKNLPEKNKPKNFRGAVGKFSLTCSLDKDRVSTDDAGNLALTISGSGNMSLINAPDIQWPKNVDVYDAKIKEQLDNQHVPIAGSKTFLIPFTVSKAGNYSLPPVHFSWFDPSTGTYDSTKTEPIAFHVSQGNHGQFAVGNVADKQSTTGFLTITGLEWGGGIVLVAGLTVFLLFVFFRKKHKESDLESRIELDDLKNERPEETFTIPDNPLGVVHEKLESGDAESFYKDLELALKKYLSLKLKIPAHEMTTEKVLEGMDKCNVGIGTTRLFESLVREIELGLYARNSHAGQMRYLYEKSAELIALLDKQICT